MTTTHRGSCLCGRVRVEAAGAPNNVANCHCRLCQKASGAAYLTLAEFPQARVTWSGVAPQWRASSDKAERAFCPHCGGALAFHFLGKDTVDIAAVLFDDADALAPQDDLWTGSRRAWTVLDERLPHHPQSRRKPTA